MRRRDFVCRKERGAVFSVTSTAPMLAEGAPLSPNPIAVSCIVDSIRRALRAVAIRRCTFVPGWS
jgi:hypothetical protein